MRMAAPEVRHAQRDHEAAGNADGMHQQSLQEEVLMLEFVLLFLLVAMAISNFSDILATVDLLDRPRDWFVSRLPRLGKLATCKYCQSWWMSAASSPFLVMWAWPSGLQVPLWASIPVCWVALHFVAKTLHCVDDGIPVVFPKGLFVLGNEAAQEESEE